MGIEDTVETRPCSECGAQIILDPVRGERVCSDCGLVREDIVIASAGNEAFFPPVCDPESPADSFEAHNCGGYSLIDTVCSNLNLPPEANNESKHYFRQGYGRLIKGRTLGRPIDVLAAASILLACRLSEDRYPRFLSRIVKASGVPQRDIIENYRDLIKITGARVQPLRPIDYIPQITGEFGFDHEVCDYALQLARRVEREEVVVRGKLNGIVAGLVDLAVRRYGWRRLCPRRDIGAVADVSASTVGARSRELAKDLRLDFDYGWY